METWRLEVLFLFMVPILSGNFDVNGILGTVKLIVENVDKIMKMVATISSKTEFNKVQRKP